MGGRSSEGTFSSGGVVAGAYDVGTVLAMYEQDDRPSTQPMHGTKGEVRRNPSTDQKKVRRQMTVQKQAAEQAAPIETIPQLLARAAKAPTLAEQQGLMAEVERRTTERTASFDAGRALDFTVREAVEIVPRGLHELHTQATDWLMAEGLHATASVQDAEHLMIAEASMWFGRVPDYVKEDQGEFRVQAVNKGTYLASQYGDHADAARQAFVSETERLYRQGAKTGAFQVKTAALVHDLEGGGMVEDGSPEPGNAPADGHGAPHHDIDATLPDTKTDTNAPGLQSEVDRVGSGADAEGVRGMAESYAQHQLRGGSLQAVAALHADEDAHLAAALAGMGDDPTTGDASAANTNGVRESAEDFVAHQQQDAQQHQAASGLPQVGMPTDVFAGAPSGPQPPVDSNRAPALQELAEFQGWDGTSVVPPGNSGAAELNNDYEPNKDHAQTQGFPVSGSFIPDPQGGNYPAIQVVDNRQLNTHAAKVAAQLTKESDMTEATCPTCAGHGRVAVRQANLQTQAYSGLPQIDQIVNADETPGATPLPPQVAFPWQMDPANVQRTMAEAEQQVATRPQGRPGAPGAGGGPGGAVTAQQHQANGRDNSGWIGDMGAKGIDYPGNSTPAYDGSNNLGQPDPVYGFGGDQPNQPHNPYGEEEANDFTNNPGMNWQPGQDTHADQGYRQVTPGMNTQGSLVAPDGFPLA
jgi:hypothetical protein